MKNTSKRLTTNPLWAALRRYDYRGAFEKIAFTTIGLWLALFINNWNDGRKQRRDERELLHELRTALRQDSGDVADTQRGFEYRLKGCRVVLDNLSDTATVTDSLCEYFQFLDGYSFLLANTGPYETLKSRGFELIQNDSLRLSVTTLYDVKYEAVLQLEKYYTQFYANQLVPVLLSELRRTDRGLEPVDWPRLRSDNRFRQTLLVTQHNNEFLLQGYQNLALKINRLLRQLDRELG